MIRAAILYSTHPNVKEHVMFYCSLLYPNNKSWALASTVHLDLVYVASVCFSSRYRGGGGGGGKRVEGRKEVREREGRRKIEGRKNEVRGKK